MTFQGKHFPGDYRDDLYVFGISGARRIGSDRELIQNPTFGFSRHPRGAWSLAKYNYININTHIDMLGYDRVLVSLSLV